MIVIVDYGMSNTMSVKNSLRALGAEVTISREKSVIESASHIILPGVGAFADGMRNLQEFGLIETLRRVVFDMKKPFLGICLGMQMLATTGEENGSQKGLGFIPGVCRRLRVDETTFRVPHIGWNDVEVVQKDPLFTGIEQPIFYFDHGYHLSPQDTSIIIGATDYGEKFAAAIKRDNIYGVQFHPEKSQHAGMTLLGNFLDI